MKAAVLARMRRASWVLLAVAAAVSFAVEVPPGLVPENAWRTLQALCFAVALLHIAISQLLAAGEARLDPPFDDLLVGGTALTLLGAALFPGGPPRLVVTLGLTLLLAVILLLPGSAGIARSAVGMVLGLGITLDLFASLVTAGLLPGLDAWLGPNDGLRLRYLRLARAACGALPVLALLLNNLPRHDAWVLARRALLVGMVSMPLVLLAGAVHPAAKYGLPVPAFALVLGVSAASVVAWRTELRVATLGWSIILASMAIGVLVGVYAFDGPAPAPPAMASYSDPSRC